jgi:hypothetical protein
MLPNLTDRNRVTSKLKISSLQGEKNGFSGEAVCVKNRLVLQNHFLVTLRPASMSGLFTSGPFHFSAIFRGSRGAILPRARGEPCAVREQLPPLS